ncbi:MAG: riboflavin synthase [Campylobacteraceae bacterium 4484_4]|nr:MAG: riboflavin synthase [Campylobacteraceae bacterium 4484_4]
MFTGLIRETATVEHFSGDLLTIGSDYRPGIGDSVAVNGACLTVVKVGNGSFTVELSPETRALIATENLRGRVHIEPAMQLSDRLEGHIVQGHIDTTGEILRIEKSDNSYDFFIKLDPEFLKFVIPKGSIAIDGVSLTVNDVYRESFRLTIIPHTMQNTLFAEYRPGRRVNIETDMFARYLYRMFGKKESLDWETVDRILAGY